MTRHVEKLLRFNGETKTINEWAEVTGISKQLIRQRLKLGWSTHDALTAPIKGRK